MIKLSEHTFNGLRLIKIKGDDTLIEIDDDVLEFLNRIDIVGKNVIDGGSNIGLYSLEFSNRIGNGIVYSFEMQPLIFEIGKRNFELNNKSNIVAANNALSDTSGELVGFTEIDYFSGKLSSSGVRTEPNVDIMGKVSTVAIDDLELINIGLIKLDIEGHEPKALQGMWRTIDKWKPRMIIEISPGYLGSGGADELIETIRSHGYSITGNKSYNYFCEPI